MISTYWTAGLFQQLLSRLDVDIYNEVSLHCSELLFVMVGVADQVDSLAGNPVRQIGMDNEIMK